MPEHHLGLVAAEDYALHDVALLPRVFCRRVAGGVDRVLELLALLDPPGGDEEVVEPDDRDGRGCSWAMLMPASPSHNAPFAPRPVEAVCQSVLLDLLSCWLARILCHLDWLDLAVVEVAVVLDVDLVAKEQLVLSRR